MIPAFANHIWQSTVFTMAAWVLTLALRRNRAAVRYGVWLAASVKFLIPFSLLVSAGGQLGSRTASAGEGRQWSLTMEQIGEPFGVHAIGANFPRIPTPAGDWMPAALGVIWLCGFAVTVVFCVRSWRRIAAVRHSAAPLPLHLPIPSMATASRLEPGVFGIWRPVLLMPEGIDKRLTPAQLDAVIAHERCHARRRDNLTGAMHMAVEAIFWFHPLVYWLRARLVEERERACDEAVLSAGVDPREYAEGILGVCTFYLETPRVCAGITGADLKRRVARIVAAEAGEALGRAHRAILAAVAFAAVAGPVAAGLLFGSAVRAQELPAAREFDAVSVKPDSQRGPGWVSGWKRDPTMLRVIGYSLTALVEKAYHLKPYQIVWKHPGRIESERFELEARTAEPATEAEMMRMLQPVLTERFGLIFHRETRKIPVLLLDVAPHGAKLRPASTTEGPNLDVRKDHITAMHLGMDDFADVLGQFVTERPVFNRTRLKNEYEFHLEFAPKDDAMGGPSIFSALPEQLGLRLEAGRAPVEVMVIDRAQRPSGN